MEITPMTARELETYHSTHYRQGGKVVCGHRSPGVVTTKKAFVTCPDCRHEIEQNQKEVLEVKIHSSWIEAIKYRPGTFIIGPLIGYNALAIFTDRGDALLYVGRTPEALPSWISGLLQAGCGGKSVGKAYNKLLKGRPDDVWYQRIEGLEKVFELRKMFRV